MTFGLALLSFFGCGFAMFFLAPALFMVIAVSLVSFVGLVATILVADNIVFGLVAWLAAVVATQVGYFSALAVAYRKALRPTTARKTEKEEEREAKLPSNIHDYTA